MIINKYGVEHRQIELLDMIKQVDHEFKKIGIKYSLASGTLLGAIRHNGFIPWDDDIDIIVSREEYKKIVLNSDAFSNLVLKTYLWTPRIQKIEDKDSTGIMIPTIDIFIGDDVPDNSLVQKIKVLRIKILQGMLKSDIRYNDYSLFYKLCIFITHIFGKFFTEEYLLKQYEKVSQIGSGSCSEKVCFYNGMFKYVGVKFNKSIFDKYEEHIFEDCMLPITSEYDHFLTVNYGDYMTLPKENERQSIHVN